MQKKRIRQFIINTSLVIFVSLIIFRTSWICKAEANYISYKFIMMAFICFWIMPIFFILMEIKKRLIDEISKIFSNMFRAVIVLNMFAVVSGSESEKYRIILNWCVILICLVIAGVHIYLETRPRCGLATKSECERIGKGLDMLRVNCLLLEKEKQEKLSCLISDLELCTQGEKRIVHGIDMNIFQECSEIQNSILANDEDAINLHIEMALWLVHLSEELEE